MCPLIEFQSVTKIFRSNWTYAPLTAISELSLAVLPGEVYGLIGHNGAGKTTAFKMVVGLLHPTRGRILWDGVELTEPAQRAAIGFSPEQPYFYDYLTVSETLNFYGQLYGMSAADRQSRVDELLEGFHLESKRKARMRTLSKGNMQRVAVAQAIMHRPRLAILDEPMSGLDPAGRKEMRDLITHLNHDGTTVVFSSHVLSDAEAVCDRVGILADGALREVVTISANDEPPEGYLLTVHQVSATILAHLDELAGGHVTRAPDRFEFSFVQHDQLARALELLRGDTATIESVIPLRPSLEDRFLHYVRPDVAAGN